MPRKPEGDAALSAAKRKQRQRANGRTGKATAETINRVILEEFKLALAIAAGSTTT